MKTHFLLMLFLLFCLSCGKIEIEDRIIERLSEGDFKLPSKYGFCYLFFTSTDNKIATANVNTLHFVFATYYSKRYKNFKNFLSDVLNQKIQIQQNQLINRDVDYFTLNARITEDYSKMPFTEYVSKYCERSKSDPRKYILARKYRNDKNIFTILYFLFTNNYWIVFDDGLGEFIISKEALV